MKPDWKDAPEWANWLAMDENGIWHWFKQRPVFVKDSYWRTASKFQTAFIDVDAKNTLEAKPQ